MTPALRRIGLPALAAAGAFAALALAAGPAAERMPFRDLAPDDPVRETIRAVLEAPAAAVRKGFTDKDWRAEGFAEAWDLARDYFPARTYFVRPGTYFMTHGFDPGGRRFMEVHESEYLALCAANGRTFTAGGILAEYARMRGADDGREAAAFRDKMGRLEVFFLDEAAHGRLRAVLGPRLHRRLLGALGEENRHMLAGGLIHEGIHAGVEERAAALLQTEFERGERPVQWDELGAFMAEAVYHARFCRWAVREVDVLEGEIEAALGALEPLRRRPGPPAGGDRSRFEAARARAWAFASLTRLRMRETWQSALRIGSLVAGFRADYVRGGPPPEVAGLLAALDRDAAAFIETFRAAAQGAELSLRTLEGTLELWTAWAEGERPFPPPNTDSHAVARRLSAVVWPAPPVEAPLALRRIAAAALRTERPSR